MKKYLFVLFLALALFSGNFAYAAGDSDLDLSGVVPTLLRVEDSGKSDSSRIIDSVRGRIVLQVEDLGEAWYVDPVSGERYYLRDGKAVMAILRTLGLGISENDFSRLKSGDAGLIEKLKGRILIRAEKDGEAYYLNPKDNGLNYLYDGDSAYKIMTDFGIGISTADLSQIPISDKSAYGASAVFDEEYRDGAVSRFDSGINPKNVTRSVLAHYWAEKINRLRRERGETQLKMSRPLVDTATEWAIEIGKSENPSLERPNEQVVHDWIGTRLLADEFYELNDRFFLEQIGWTTMEDSIIGGYEALDAIFENFMEKTTSPSGYNPVLSSAWDNIGVGFYFKNTHDNNIMMYMVAHLANFEN